VTVAECQQLPATENQLLVESCCQLSRGCRWFNPQWIITVSNLHLVFCPMLCMDRI